MKNSLLLLGSILALGCASAASATDACTPHPDLTAGSIALAGSSSASQGVLATLGALLSGVTHNPADNSTADSSSTAKHDTGGSAANPPDTTASNNSDSDTLPAPTANAASSSGPLATPASGGAPGKHPSLGWQSLLPGSIQ